MGWSDQEQLVIVLEDGNSLIYDIHGKLVRNFLLLDAVTTVHVLECHFWGNGVVVISSDMQLFVAEGLSSAEGDAGFRKYTLVSGLSASNPYTSMAIIPPLIARSGLLEVCYMLETDLMCHYYGMFTSLADITVVINNVCVSVSVCSTEGHVGHHG
jgi:hypothetical protein